MENDNVTLIVDLDHTLIDTDLLLLSSLGVLLKRPWLIGHYFFWLSKGKGFLKDQLVRRFEINITELPYNENVISYIIVFIFFILFLHSFDFQIWLLIFLV